MAEGFARALAPPEVEVWSAGSEPALVNPLAIEAMREVDRHHRPAVAGDRSGVLARCRHRGDAVRRGGGDLPGGGGEVRRVHWLLPDPSAAPEAQRLEGVRTARDEIRWRWRRCGRAEIRRSSRVPALV
jgi:arsenate reductase